MTNWQFNAWAKYSDWQLDDQVPGRVTELLGVAEWQPSARIGRRPDLECAQAGA